MEEKQSEKHFWFGNGCIFLAIVFWGVNIPVTKALIPDWMTAESIAAVRLVGGCILFWLTSLFFKCEKIRKEDWKKIISGGVVGLFAFIYFFITALKFGKAIDISIIMTLPPMFVILIGVIFEHNRPSLLEYLGVAVSFAGAVIVIMGGSHGDGSFSGEMLGDILAIVSCVCFALYLVILEKPSREYKPLSLLRWVFLFSALPGLFLLDGFQDWPILRSSEIVPWLEILFILFCPTFFAYFLTQPAIKNIGAELVSIYQYLVPVVAALCAMWMGIEQIRPMQIMAMAVIVGGMILTNIGKKRRVAVTATK